MSDKPRLYRWAGPETAESGARYSWEYDNDGAAYWNDLRAVPLPVYPGDLVSFSDECPPELEAYFPEVTEAPIDGVYVWAGYTPDVEHWCYIGQEWIRFSDGSPLCQGDIFSLAAEEPALLTEEQIAALPRVTELPSR